MDRTDTARLGKRLMREHSATAAASPGEIDLGLHALIAYSSEDPDHPVEHLIDTRDGRGGTRWLSGRPNVTEHLTVQFDRPQRISRIVYEAEECGQERTQQVRVEASTDFGRSYRQVLAQDYTFSPGGATFQHEDLRLDLHAITRLRLIIVPNKGGAGIASLTTVRFFS